MPHSHSQHKGLTRRRFLGRAAQAGVVASAGIGARDGVGEADGADAPKHRYVDRDKCIGCGQCVPLCPMGAIRMVDGKSLVNAAECAECGVCRRSGVCPADAICDGDLEWPRVLRSVFSNPLAEHKGTGVRGRGSEGLKTNDSQDRYRRGQMGVFVELGRPVLGARFRDVERVVKYFKLREYAVCEHNPVADLVADPSTGALKPEILDEKVISCLVEFILPETAARELVEMVEVLRGEVESVFNVSVALRARDDGTSPIEALFGPEVFRLPNGKVNLGLAQRIVGNA